MSSALRNESGIRKLKIFAAVVFCIIGALVAPVESFLADGAVEYNEVVSAAISFFLALTVVFIVVLLINKRRGYLDN
ncbi:MAG: large-conductance mechanosensitive channel, partial [Oceanicoccus sp.]